MIVGAWVLTAVYVVWANRQYDAERRRLRAPGARSADACRPRSVRRRSSAIIFFLDHRRADAGRHLVGGAAHAIDARVLRRRALDQSAPERPRAGRRLHERGVVSRHRRAGGAARLRRDDLRDRLAGRLAGADVPDRRAAPESRQVHLRRRRRVPAAAGAGAHRRGVRRHPHGALLRDRADGRRRQPDHG